MGENLSEKVSVNVNSSTLSEIDLLVDHGYYSNRSDFINQALRESLSAQRDTINRIVGQHEESSKRGERQWFIGLFGLTATEVETLHRQGERFPINGYGVLIIGDRVDLKKLFEVVTEISVRGRVICPPEVRAHYGLK